MNVKKIQQKLVIMHKNKANLVKLLENPVLLCYNIRNYKEYFIGKTAGRAEYG